jgi:hypothetical protein
MRTSWTGTGWAADEDSAEAVRISWVVNEHSEAVAVVSVEPILRSKPHEALIVLHNLSNPGLRQPFGCGKTCEANVLSVDNGQFERPGIYARLCYRARRDLTRICAQLRNHGYDVAVFDATTPGLQQLATWLHARHVRSVALDTPVPIGAPSSEPAA